MAYLEPQNIFSFHFILVIVYHSQKAVLCDARRDITVLTEFIHILLQISLQQHQFLNFQIVFRTFNTIGSRKIIYLSLN